MSSAVGIDVSKDKLDVVSIDEQQERHYLQVENNVAGWKELLRFLKKSKGQAVRVCLEATGRYSEGVANALYEASYRLSVVNPARIRGYANAQLRRNKTDKLEAHISADVCRTQETQACCPAQEEIRVLQGLVRHLAVLETDKGSVDNRLRDSAALPALVVQQLRTQQTLLTAQLEPLKSALQDHIDHHPDLKKKRDLMDSITGIGPLTAAKLLAECRPLTEFDDVRQLVAFAGLNPAHHQSGSSIKKKTLISKCGNSAIRAALYRPAISAKNHNPILRAFAQRWRAKGLCEMAIIAAVMPKLLHLVYGVLKSGQPFDPNFQAAP